mmetsp:Transcript_37684/g.67262  ORF Transcript_37684/g.67262 Transcript_37684/m.67262 type:complete len:209 (-) Transcript_37684:165-791(-)
MAADPSSGIDVQNFMRASSREIGVWSSGFSPGAVGAYTVTAPPPAAAPVPPPPAASATPGRGDASVAFTTIHSLPFLPPVRMLKYAWLALMKSRRLPKWEKRWRQPPGNLMLSWDPSCGSSMPVWPSGTHSRRASRASSAVAPRRAACSRRPMGIFRQFPFSVFIAIMPDPAPAAKAPACCRAWSCMVCWMFCACICICIWAFMGTSW